MSSLTPEILRRAADRISPGGSTVGYEKYSCLAVGAAAGLDAEAEYSNLILRAGWPSYSEGIPAASMTDDDEPNPIWYHNNSQSVRFMMLEFLAHYLEDGA